MFRLPVLTYVVKIVYKDNGYSFSLCRDQHPTMALACIPNGVNSRLFGYNIIDNFKTYDYYKETEGDYYSYVYLPENYDALTTEEKKQYTDNIFITQRQYADLSQQLGKTAYFDAIRRVTWWITSNARRKCFKPVKGGASVRFNNETLNDRYDSKNLPWEGYVEYTILEELA